MKVLIVDDQPIVHQGIRRIFEKEYPGSKFGNALEAGHAIQLFGREGWDVVILDLLMPGFSGLGLLKQIRTERPKLPILVFSKYPEEQYAIRVFKSGASGYLSKQSTPDQLAAAVNKVLSGGKHLSCKLAEHLATTLDQDLSRAPHELLSDREFEVLCMLASGKTTTGIADQLSLSVKTVSTYRTRILGKLRVKSSSELMRYAIDHELDLA